MVLTQLYINCQEGYLSQPQAIAKQASGVAMQVVEKKFLIECFVWHYNYVAVLVYGELLGGVYITVWSHL